MNNSESACGESGAAEYKVFFPNLSRQKKPEAQRSGIVQLGIDFRQKRRVFSGKIEFDS